MVKNVVIYGRWEKHPDGHQVARYSGLPGMERARDLSQAVELMNMLGYEVVSISESGSPGDMAGNNIAWSNQYVVGKLVTLPE